jgi:hypothetical protein
MTEGNDLSSGEGLSLSEQYAATAEPADTESVLESEGTPPETVLDADQYGNHLVAVKVDGEDRMVPLSEIREAHMRQADYTQKTQALADERKAFETQRDTLDGYERFVKRLEADPEGTVEALVAHYGLTPQYESSVDEYGESDPEMVQRDAAINALTEKLDRLVRDQQIEREKSVVATEYPDIAPDEILAFAAKNNLNQGQMGLAAQALQAERLLAEKQEFEKATEAIAAAKKDMPPVSDGATRGAGVITKDESAPASILEAWNLAGVE